MKSNNKNNVSAEENMRERVRRELMEGKEHATKLMLLLRQNKAIASSSLVLAEAHTHSHQIHTCFARSLSLLTSSLNGHHVGPPSTTIHYHHLAHSTHSSRTPVKDRRGSYKRRKAEETWSNVSQNTEDNYGWRKYGQKEIFNSIFPRSYFRCTRKNSQGCRATKQVQQIQENPVMYQITYIGVHTCKDTTLKFKAPQMITYSDDTNLVNSHDDDPDSKEQQQQDLMMIIKQEYPKEDTQSDLTDNNLDHSLWSELKDFEPSKPAITNISPIIKMPSSDDDHNNVAGTGGASQSLDMDFGVLVSSHFFTDFLPL